MANEYAAFKLQGRKVDIHRFLMEGRLGRKLHRWEVVHHINGDKKDNRIENLQVMTLAEHGRHHYKAHPQKEQARQKLRERFQGEGHPQSVLTEEKVRAIKIALAGGAKATDLSLIFGVHRAQIGRIGKGQSWKHVTI